jgi:hypothetical protein
MRTQRNWISTAFALVPVALAAIGESDWSPDPEQALLGRTKAVFQVYDVSAMKSPISGAQALLGEIAGNGARASAVERRNGITAEFALLGR